MLDLNRYADAAEFSERAAPFLLAHEAEHNLLLGIAASLARRTGSVGPRPYLATVERASSVVAVALMTPPHNLILSRLDADEAALSLIAADVREAHPMLPGVLGPTDVTRAFAERWWRLTGQPARLAVAQRIYRLEAVTPVVGVAGALRRATVSDRDVLVAWLAGFYQNAIGESNPSRATQAVDARLTAPDAGLCLWEDGRPVALVGFGEPTPNGVRIGPVYTPPENRRRGYASAAVAVLSQLLLDEGYRWCCLFTDLANPTANRIYLAVGYRPVCDVDEYRFGRPPDFGGV